MAEYLGTVRGSRGPTSRLGGKKSGLHVSAQSWKGSVAVHLGDFDGEPFVTIRVGGGSTPSPDGCLYHGRMADLLTLVRRAARDGKTAIPVWR